MLAFEAKTAVTEGAGSACSLGKIHGWKCHMEEQNKTEKFFGSPLTKIEKYDKR